MYDLITQASRYMGTQTTKCCKIFTNKNHLRSAHTFALDMPSLFTTRIPRGDFLLKSIPIDFLPADHTSAVVALLLGRSWTAADLSVSTRPVCFAPVP